MNYKFMSFQFLAAVIGLTAHIAAASPADTGLSWASVIRFSPNGQRLISAGILNNAKGEIVERRLRVWDVHNGRELHRLPAEPSTSDTERFSIGPTLLLPDFKTMLTTWGAGEVKPVDVHCLYFHKFIRGFNGYISSLVLSPDKKILAFGMSGAVEFRDAHTYRLLRTYVHGAQGTTVQFGPNSQIVACFWDCSKPQTVAVTTARQVSHPRWFYRIQDASAFTFSKNGKLLAKAKGKTIEIWRTPTNSSGHKLATFTTTFSATRTLQFSPNGRVLAVGGTSLTTRPVEFIQLPATVR